MTEQEERHTIALMQYEVLHRVGRIDPASRMAVQEEATRYEYDELADETYTHYRFRLLQNNYAINSEQLQSMSEEKVRAIARHELNTSGQPRTGISVQLNQAVKSANSNHS